MARGIEDGYEGLEGDVAAIPHVVEDAAVDASLVAKVEDVASMFVPEDG